MRWRNANGNDNEDKAALLLRRPSVQFVLAKGGKSGIEGVLSLQDLLRIFSSKKNPRSERIKNHMKTKLLRLKDSTPIAKASALMR